MKQSKWSAVLIALAVMAAVGSPAGARTFTVSACDAASGANRSWLDDSSASPALVARMHCPALGPTDGLLTRSTTLSTIVSRGEGSGWRFDAAPGTSIVGLSWAGDYWTTGNGWSSGMDSSLGRVFGCGPSTASCSRRWTPGERPLARSVGGAQWLRFGIRCVGSSSCKGGDGKTHPNALASAWYLRVTVDDPIAPRVALSGSALEASWIKPGATLDALVTDSSGVSSVALDREGIPMAAATRACDFTKPRPCSDSAEHYLLTTPGLAQWGVTATDAAGNSSRESRLIGVDGDAPGRPAPPEVVGGENWRTSPHFDLKWSLPDQGPGAPIASSLLLLCSSTAEDDGCLNQTEVPATAKSVMHVRLSQPGDWTARLVMKDAAGNFDLNNSSEPVHLKWDSRVPDAPRLKAPTGWLTRDAAAAARLAPLRAPEVLEPLSGIAGWAWAIGYDPGDAINLNPSDWISIGELPEGESEIRIRSISGSGIASRSIASAMVRIDETAPQASLESGNGGWLAAPQAVTVTGTDQAGLSGFGGGGKAESRVWLDGGLATREAGGTASVDVAIDGKHTVAADVTDAAGNRSGRVTSVVKIDRTAPERVEFIPQDVADPRVVRVYATDSTSGVATVVVRLRPIAGGDWKELSTEVRGGRYEAILDDRDYAAGQWEMEAVVTDEAGNKSSTMRTNLGGLALVAFPLRSTSRIEASLAVGAGVAASTPGETLPHGKSGSVSGRLLGFRDLPVEGVPVSVESAPLMTGGDWTPVESAVTDHAGRFTFDVPPGPSRRFRIRWSGDHRTVGTSYEVKVEVASRSGIVASPRSVRVGGQSVFSGQLSGGWVPQLGKMVLIQALIGGRGWQTFAAVHSDAAGRWSAPYRFRAAVKRVRYSIRALVPAEAGYPFASSATTPVQVLVIG